MNAFDSPRFSPWFAAVISLCTFVLWCLMPTETLIHLVEEGQLVENLTLWAYGFVLLILLVLPIPRFPPLTRLAVLVVLLAMMAREADLNKIIDHTSMLKLRFWFGDLPLIDKVYGFLSLAPIAAACLYLLIRYGTPLRRGIREGASYAVTVATFIFLIVLTNILDRILGMIKSTFGWHAPHWLVALETSQEEFLELSLPILALMAALQYRRIMLGKKSAITASPPAQPTR